MKGLLLTVASVMTCVFGLSSVNVAAESPRYCEFSSDKAIREERELRDYNGNEFKLYELDGGYAIYSVKDEGEIFIEGSYQTNSPYCSYLDKEKLYYLGPGNYYYQTDSTIVNIVDGEQSNVENYESAAYQLGTLVETRSKEPTPDPNQTKTDTAGYTVVNRAEYFKKLRNFPQNWWGECGLVSLSIMLSYYDTFFNDNFIPNNLEYEATYYKWVSTRSSDGGKYEEDYKKVENLAKKVTTTYKNVSQYPYTDWSSMPGTTYAMHDYLFDNYMQNFFGIGWDDVGYPMLDGELKSTMNKYLNANCSSDVKDHISVKSGHLFNTHKRPKEYIYSGLPTCLVLKSYDSSIGGGKAHVVVAYGYKDGKFLAHFGWYPGSTTAAEVVINSATIYGYYTFEYTGSHVHSKNVSMTSGGVTKYICGCGYVQ